MNYPKDRFLRATRREDFEDDLFAAQVKIRGQIHKAAMFFEVTETGYEVRSPDEALFHSGADGVGRWYVAVDPSSGSGFGLNGFVDPMNDFNRLAAFAQIQLTSEDAVKAWASFYLTVSVGNSYGTFLAQPVDLRRQVEDIAESYAATRKHDFVPTRWLEDLKRKGVKPQFGVRLQREGDRFYSQIDSVAISDERRPVLEELQFVVSSRGAISDQMVMPLFPR
jgi:hypothetical protein